METLIIILIAVLVVGFGTTIFMLSKKKEKKPEGEFVMLQNQINEMSRQVDEKMGKVSERLVRLDETTKQVMDFTRQLQDLQDILKNPKQRGALGEYYLETILGNVFPGDKSYKMQYKFNDGTIVDAAIFIKNKIVPVDSKFSLENYNRLIHSKEKSEREVIAKQVAVDLKNRINETSKYIKPEEGTTDFALMFIPSEALYYDLLINKVGSIEKQDLIEYATGKKRVIIVSPTSFLAYIQTVIQGLRALKIEESAKDIQKWVGDLGRHLSVFKSNFEKLGGHLSTSIRSFESASDEFNKIDTDVDRITEKKNSSISDTDGED